MLLFLHRSLVEHLDLLTGLLGRARVEGESCTVAIAIVKLLLRTRRAAVTGLKRFRSVDRRT